MVQYDDSYISKKVEEYILKRREGANWDFKREWHKDNARLLHDILCMANNLSEDDGFIIIGIDDNCTICGANPNDCNRKKQAEINNMLSEIEFSGDKPKVQVYHDIRVFEKTIDVIVIIQKNNGPYFLRKRYVWGKNKCSPCYLYAFRRYEYTHMRVSNFLSDRNLMEKAVWFIA